MKKLYNLFKAIGYLLFLFEKSNSLNSSSKYGRVFEIINNLGIVCKYFNRTLFICIINFYKYILQVFIFLYYIIVNNNIV